MVPWLASSFATLVPFRPLYLRWLHWSLPFFVLLIVADSFSIDGGKDRGLEIELEERRENLLAGGADEDLPLDTVVGRLVLGRAVHPYVTAAVDVTGPDVTQLARPHAGLELQADHRLHMPGQVGQDRFHERLGHRTHGLALSGLGVALAETFDP